jgi:hypothetical protein
MESALKEQTRVFQEGLENTLDRIKRMKEATW